MFELDLKANGFRVESLWLISVKPLGHGRLTKTITNSFLVSRISEPYTWNLHFVDFDENHEGTHQFDLFCTSTIFISSTFSVLRPTEFTST